MQTYSEFAPTGFDSKGAFLARRQDWLVVPVTQTRDSGALDRANFKAALEQLHRKESDDVEVHRFGHWGPGWFEIILVRPDTEAAKIGLEIEAALADYPVLDDDAFSAEEYEEAENLWSNASVKGRLWYIANCGADPKVSMFAARRDELPNGIYVSELIRD